ncbi:hypothetical protein DUNSADRAFT_5661 [Dunaliella salina]|uniref:Encoded protein n=1 Tax=Dunaliella salina TaxID=3046 RepID=A0ABQ7GPT7_DUNSA|nr:hypothetical protein DUNSADRAFT_5661 [Dunaliella salina]|eukprot:KAF5836628.1 hypothetical protein DUNSADRAFT_5661 [Dunaliella salina]
MCTSSNCCHICSISLLLPPLPHFHIRTGRESASAEPSEPSQSLPSTASGRNAPKSLIPNLKLHQARQEHQHTTRQVHWDREPKEQRASSHKEGSSRGQPSQQQQQQQQQEGQGQRQRSRREQQHQQQQSQHRERKVLDLDALYVAGRSGAGRGVHSSTWADAMDDLGDVLDGEESGPPPASTAPAKPGAPTPASASQGAGAASGKGASGAGAAAGAGGAGKPVEPAAESSEEEEGELPSEEGEYVEPS